MPSETPSKHLIARAFSQAAAGYDAYADVQQQAALRLLQLLESRFSDGLNRKTVADIGAGSGWVSEKIRSRGANVLALDLAEGMLQHIARHRRADCCLLADAESLPLADSSVNACFSSLALQWCTLEQAAAEMQRVIQPGGCAAVATIGAGSLQQLKQAWQAADEAAHVNRFLTESEIQTAFNCFPNLRIHTETHTQYFPTLQALLHSLKNIGANHVIARENKGLTGKQRWQRFQTAYENMRAPNGMLPLDYRITYVVAW
ncbi:MULTISPECIES: malonyl-ACP O-methyltransferase BioC [unclassified Neisseria]|uniref:malonyl-ACP O-methyltransferase BioC n=1 Tax=unclassified Neisseria TaxID=2623750 RepID=UPI002666B1E1|nr:MULTISPECIES: malonyl-ACP O-methyltransferase BioC [unclassified Neisseria]MDO1509018.1 malonyl-ACP O-methyltransferase BioC [Neisseria sp. MVDL19-042950]MDO1515277.1 malonyl-ACP O-methyltransferase BioC [Neisseria sp. MVDL18-041461]MDO1562637.1 malonyl-ACP O-methyltransferase BioC [Neisseria sp. MVDL20-010259]